MRKAVLHFRDITNPNVNFPNEFTAQGETGDLINSFNGANYYLNYLENNDNYYLVKVVSDKDGQQTQLYSQDSTDPDNLDKFNWGKFGKSNASQFIVYVTNKPETTSHQVTETVHYIFQDENGKTIDTISRPDYTAALTFKGSRPYGSNSNYTYKDDDQSFNAITIAPQIGFKLVSATNNDGKNVLENSSVEKISDINHDSKDVVINVVFKKQPNETTSNKVTETIHHIFKDENGKTINTVTRPDHVATLNFTGSRPYGSNGAYSYSNDNQSFSSIAITPEVGYKLISASTADGKNVLNGSNVEAVSGINHDSKDIVVNVVFQKQSDETVSNKVTETIHYIFQDENGKITNSITRPDHVATLNFTGSRPYGSDRNYTYNNNNQAFGTVAIIPENGYKIISASTADGKNILAGSNVEAISDIHHNSQNIIINVIFRKEATTPENTNPEPTPVPTPTPKPVPTPQPTVPEPTKPSEPSQVTPTKPTPEAPIIPSTPSDQIISPESEIPSNTVPTTIANTHPETFDTDTIMHKSENTNTNKSSITTVHVKSQNENNSNSHSSINKRVLTSQNKTNKLPQTGENSTKFLSLLGLAIGTFASLIEFGTDYKRKNK